MSMALKCDRCGKCFDPTELSEKLFLHIDSAYVRAGKHFKQHSGFDLNLLNKDYCDDCSQIILKEINKQENVKDEKKPNPVISDFNDSINDFFNKLSSRGRDILRDYVYSNSDGKASERESNSEQESKD